MSEADSFERGERLQRVLFLEDLRYLGIAAWLPFRSVSQEVQSSNFRTAERGYRVQIGDRVAVCEEPTSSPPIYRIVEQSRRDGNPVPWNVLEPEG